MPLIQSFAFMAHLQSIGLLEPVIKDYDDGNMSAGAPIQKVINLKHFIKRLKSFYVHWTNHRSTSWASVEAIAVAMPPLCEDIRYLKSSTFSIWLFGLELPDTIMLLMNKQIHILSGKRIANLLRTLQKPAMEAVGVRMVIHVLLKDDEDADLMIDKMLTAIRAGSKVQNPVVGYLPKQAPEGKLLNAWLKKLLISNLQLTDIANGFSDLFAVKDDKELILVMKAASLASSVMNKSVIPKLEKIMDGLQKVSHAELTDATENALNSVAKSEEKFNAECVDVCYPPIFQSGGKFDFRPDVMVNDEELCYDQPGSVIIVAFGSRYESYCANVARSFLINSTQEQLEAYEVLCKAHDAAIVALKPGNTISASYMAAYAVVRKQAPQLLPNLTKSAGTGMGIEFRELRLCISATNHLRVKTNMVFNVSLGFENLKNLTDDGTTLMYSLLLADTVVVGDAPPEVLTASCSKDINWVGYTIEETIGD